MEVYNRKQKPVTALSCEVGGTDYPYGCSEVRAACSIRSSQRLKRMDVLLAEDKSQTGDITDQVEGIAGEAS